MYLPKKLFFIVIFIGTHVSSSFAVTRMYNKNNNENNLEQEKHQPMEKSIFSDAYSIQLGAAKPSFSSDLKYYKEFYGTPKFMGELGIEYRFFNTDYLSVGVGGRFSHYSADGHQKKKPSVDQPEVGDLTNAEGKLSLTLVPYQINLNAEIRPFGNKSWISLSTWLGYEELFWQEVRMEESETVDSNDENAFRGKTFAFAEDSTEDKEEESKRITNTGWNHGMVFGASINFLLNPLDDRSVKSMKESTGLGRIFLSPYFQVTSKMSGKLLLARKDSSQVSFSRQTFGIALTFSS